MASCMYMLSHSYLEFNFEFSCNTFLDFRMTGNLIIGNESAPVLCQVLLSQELVQYCYSGVMF